MSIVPGEGKHGTWAIVGEAPGRTEAEQGRPFVGRTGQEQDAHLRRNNLTRQNGYLTNLRKTFVEGNAAPTEEEVKEWGPRLIAELRKVNPKVVMTAGAHSTHFLLGADAHLEAVHGMPQRSPLLPDSCVVMPSFHPAAPFYNNELLPHVRYDYERFAKAVRREIDTTPVRDEYVGRERYVDLSTLKRSQIDDWVDAIDDLLAVDTEGVPGDEWSIQFSTSPGAALVARRSAATFAYLMAAVRRKLRSARPLLLGHNWMYDCEMAQGLGIDFLDLACPFFDTMMAAYLLCLEPQSLKMLARRWAGMGMKEYREVVGDVGKAKQVAYLESILDHEWPEVEARLVQENDGTYHLYKPKHVSRVVESILIDVYSGKETKEGPTDPRKRWRKVDDVQRKVVEKRLGKIPVGTLADIPLDRAVTYSGRDPDAVIRVYPRIRGALVDSGLASLMDLKMAMLPAAIEMKINGIGGRRSSFEKLSEKMLEEMDVIRTKISRRFYGGRPFNPNSDDQVRTIMRRRNLKGEKKTKTGKVSTSKKSIEHLRYEDEAIALVEEFRERSKIRSSFADPVLEFWPEGQDFARIKTDLKITRVSSGRFSGALLDDDIPSAPLLAIPKRTDLGRQIRDCYEAEPGYVIGSWDLDQAEMRYMADESGDESLIKIFTEGKIDVHSDTAARVFNVNYEELEADKALRKKLRDPAKRANFGVITGIQGAGLYDQLRMAGATGWSVEKCDRLISDVLRLRRGVSKYMLDCREECRRNGGITRTRGGMPRYLPNIFSEDKYLRLEAERQTHSHKIQGGAQEMLQMAIAWLHPRLKPYGDAVRWILQIHDALMIEVADGMQDIVGPLVREAMTQHIYKLRVPVNTSESWATKWGSMKD